MKKLFDIKLVVLDIDGILTNGKKSYDVNGNFAFKQFNDLDFTAIKIFKSLNIDVICITGDANNKWLEHDRNIKTFVSRDDNGKITNKLDLLLLYIKGKKISLEKIWFAGDDIFDISVMESVKYVSVPDNSIDFVKSFSNINLLKNSGEYFVSSMLNYYLNRNKILLDKKVISKIEKLDSLEASSKLMSK